MPFVRQWMEEDFTLYTDKLKLAQVNAHPRDQNIAFRDADHKYFVHVKDTNTWLQLKTSVSGVYKFFFNDFDSETAALGIAESRCRDRKSPYYWLIQSCDDVNDRSEVAKRVKDTWSLLALRASALGTRCHFLMEQFANRSEHETHFIEEMNGDNQSEPLVTAAKQWLKARFAEGWAPYRTEWSIYINSLAVHMVERSEPPDFYTYR